MTEKNIHKIAMSGATGFVGSHLSTVFGEQGWDVIPLGRKDFNAGPRSLAAKMQGADVLVNLAGAPVIGRWTDAYKKILYESRIYVTRKMVKACSLMDPKPELFISTSAVGYYDSKGTHTENKYTRSDDFLGRLAQNWEKEAVKAEEAGMRTIIFRFGIVLGKDGGALKQMLMPFQFGLGGTVGDGSQTVSWIHIRDLMRAYITAIKNPSYKGIYNLTAPYPTTNRDLTKALGKALGRPTVFSIPKFMLQLKYGEGAQVLLKGQTVFPKRLMESGFTFLFPEIKGALKDCVS